MNIIPFNYPFIIGKELDYIARAVEMGHLSGDGAFTGKCHQWLEEKLGCAKAMLTHSCTGALEMAAILCGIQPGDEVIMPSFTFVSTANAFVLRGGVPVFIDIRPDTLNIDENLIETAITPRTKAIVCVHYAGVACEMDTIMAIAARHDLLVIEDAAQALLSSYDSKYLGTIGAMGCISFHETKNVISGEGGALLINDPSLIERAEIIREKGTDRKKFFRGQSDKYTWVDIGSSYLPSELIGAFLFAQLEQAEKIIAARRSVFARYMEKLAPLAGKRLIRLPRMDDQCQCNGHIFYIILDDRFSRTEIISTLTRNGINAVFHYVPLHSSPAGRKYGRTEGAMSVTDYLSAKVLRLPLYYGMTEPEVDKVAETLEKILGDDDS